MTIGSHVITYGITIYLLQYASNIMK